MKRKQLSRYLLYLVFRGWRFFLSLRSRRLEVVGERENGRARGRHANSKRLLRRLLLPSRLLYTSIPHCLFWNAAHPAEERITTSVTWQKFSFRTTVCCVGTSALNDRGRMQWWPFVVVLAGFAQPSWLCFSLIALMYAQRNQVVYGYEWFCFAAKNLVLPWFCYAGRDLFFG